MGIFEKCTHQHKNCPHSWYQKEENLNALTHVLGMGLGIVALVIMVTDAELYQHAKMIVGVSIFGVCLVISYAASAWYHFVRDKKLKYRLRILDHIGIFLLIAGTYTPFVLVPLHGPWGWSLFGVVWGLALIGSIFKCFFVARYEWFSTLIYVLMGWVAIIAVVPIVHHLPPMGILWLVSGGLFYTFGVVFFLMETIPFMHTVWHIFVLLGSACHVIAVLFYLVLVGVVS